MKKNKKGFTLVELLAVVAVLAILVIIAMPNILGLFKTARKNTFIVESRTLYNEVKKQELFDSNKSKIYSTGTLDISGGKDLEYSISTNESGQIICFQVANSQYMWIYRNKGFPIGRETDVAQEDEVAERDEEVIIDCTGAKQFDSTIPATLGSHGSWWTGSTNKANIERIIFTYSYASNDYDETFYSDEEKVGGLVTYVKDNIAYVAINRNKRKSRAVNMPKDSSNTFSDFINLKNITGLKLLDLSKAENIDNLFGKIENGTVVSSNSLTYLNGYESFNTSNVKSAKYAFAGVKLSSIDLSRWNTSKLTDATGMFYKSGASLINLADWNTSTITNYSNMFANSSKLESINLAGWNTNGNANYTGMFDNCSNLISISADNGFNVTNKNITMFANDTKLIGSRGTTFSTDKSLYARIDTDTTPGYLSTSTSDGIMSAKLYNSGIVSGSYTELTKTGSIPPDWDFYDGARLLEIKLFSMKKDIQKTLEITVPAGMYIVNNSWTKTGNGISSVTFTKLANQGTGSYSNPQTGTLQYTFSSSASSSSIQLLVMFDTAIWDKNRKNASAMGTDNMTLSAPIVVNYNNGSSIRKISNIHSAVGVGNTSDGIGYSFYTYNYNDNIYLDDASTLLASNFLLSKDQSSVPYFYKKITYESYATFKNTNNATVYADVADGVLPSQLSGINRTGSTDKLYKGEWNNVYFSSPMNFPRVKYTVKSSDNPTINSNLTVYIKATVTTLSGQTNTFSITKTYKIRSKTLDITDLAISSGNKNSPAESYYGSSGYSGMLGIFTMANRGYQDINNIKVIFEYDTGTAKNSPPAMKVMAARPFLQNGQEVNAKITLVNDSGTEKEVPSYKIKSTSNASGAYVAAKTVARSLNLTGTYYLKKIEYTMPVVSGIDKNTKQVNYLYHNQASGSQSSGGNFMGVISKKATSTCSIYYNGSLLKKVTSTSNVTSNPGFSGYIDRINTPLGTEFNAGDDIELAINVGGVSYPYTDTQAFSKPEIYLVLPFGVNIDSVIIGSSANATKTESEPAVTKVKTINVEDVLNNVYKISTKSKVWFGYLGINDTSASSGEYASKWFRIRLTTDLSMEYTSINLRDRVFFKDQNGHISIGGSYGQYTVSDQFDVDNDGSTSDKYGTTNNPNQIINIYANEDEE